MRRAVGVVAVVVLTACGGIRAIPQNVASEAALRGGGTAVASIAIGALPRGRAGTATRGFVDVTARDAAGHVISGSYAAPIVLALSSDAATTLTVDGGKAARVVRVAASSDKIALAYTGLAIEPVTLTASAKGAKAARKLFSPAVFGIRYKGPKVDGSPEIDLTNTAADTPGSYATFVATQDGWTGSYRQAYKQRFARVKGAVNDCPGTSRASYVVTPASGDRGSKFRVKATSTAVPGKCVLTLEGGAGKKLTILLTTSLGPGLPVDLTWKFAKYALGKDASGLAQDTTDLGVFMSNPYTVLAGQSYLMYFGANFPASSQTNNATTGIRSATSTDGVNWTIQNGYRLLGDGDAGSTDTDGIPPDEGVVSGPRVVQTGTNAYRLYYQASTQGSNPPDFREKSATSTNLLNWTREQTIVDSGGSNQFSLAGHCYVLQLSASSYVMFLTGNLTAMSGSPSSVFEGTSTDGKTFVGWKQLYQEGHDPFVIQLADGRYAMFFGHLTGRQQIAISSDGINWPSTSHDTILLDQNGNEVTEASAEQPGDRSALLVGGKVQLFMNWGANGAASSTDIVQLAPQ